MKFSPRNLPKLAQLISIHFDGIFAESNHKVDQLFRIETISFVDHRYIGVKF